MEPAILVLILIFICPLLLLPLFYLLDPLLPTFFLYHSELMERSSRDVKCGTNFNPVLTVNQVFDILTSVFRDGDWPKALAASVPRRKGFVLK